MPEFKPTAPSAEAVFYRTYSRRKQDGTRESFAEAMTRCVDEIATVGKFDSAEKDLVKNQALKQHCFPSGRAFWVAGTEWGRQQKISAVGTTVLLPTLLILTHSVTSWS